MFNRLIICVRNILLTKVVTIYPIHEYTLYMNILEGMNFRE
jgi:hypothetical protein